MESLISQFLDPSPWLVLGNKVLGKCERVPGPVFMMQIATDRQIFVQSYTYGDLEDLWAAAQPLHVMEGSAIANRVMLGCSTTHAAVVRTVGNLHSPVTEDNCVRVSLKEGEEDGVEPYCEVVLHSWVHLGPSGARSFKAIVPIRVGVYHGTSRTLWSSVLLPLALASDHSAYRRLVSQSGIGSSEIDIERSVLWRGEVLGGGVSTVESPAVGDRPRGNDTAGVPSGTEKGASGGERVSTSEDKKDKLREASEPPTKVETTEPGPLVAEPLRQSMRSPKRRKVKL